MILICKHGVEFLPYGKPLRFTDVIAVIAFTKELDKNRGSAEFFFKCVGEYWRATFGCDPNNFIIMSDYGDLLHNVYSSIK